MTDIDPTLHPGHKDAGKDLNLVRQTLSKSRQMDADLLRNAGATHREAANWMNAVEEITFDLLYVIQDRQDGE